MVAVKGCLAAMAVLGMATQTMGFTMPTSGLRRGRTAVRMMESGTGPYKGPQSFPLLDQVRYPRDMKRFNRQVSEVGVGFAFYCGGI